MPCQPGNRSAFSCHFSLAVVHVCMPTGMKAGMAMALGARRALLGGGTAGSGCGRNWLCRLRHVSRLSVHTVGWSDGEEEEKGRRVVVVWDMSSSKPPSSMEPYTAALRVGDIAGAFGYVVDKSAYAEPRLPLTDSRPRTWAEEKRLEKQLEPVWYQDIRGRPPEDYTYSCSYCGRRLRSHKSLYAHFKQLHQRERAKRIHRLNATNNAQRRMDYRAAMADKECRYRAALREIVMPRALVEDGLSKGLTRAGFFVRLVTEKPNRALGLTAAESALMNQIWQAVGLGVSCLCLVCDSPRFVDVVQLARMRGLCVVAISTGMSELSGSVDMFVSWAEVASGHGFLRATEAARLWFASKGRRRDHRSSSQQLGDCTEADYDSS